MIRERHGQIHQLMVAPLGGHHYAPDLLHLGIVGGTNPIHKACYLGAQVGDADEFFEHVFGHDVGVATVGDVITVDVDVVDTQVQVGRTVGGCRCVCTGVVGVCAHETQYLKVRMRNHIMHTNTQHVCVHKHMGVQTNKQTNTMLYTIHPHPPKKHTL